MKALITTKDPYTTTLQDVETPSPQPGHVLIRVKYSSLNYKDALAITGKGRILKSYPLTPGIDASGLVEASDDHAITPGTKVLVTGCGLGETVGGGYADYIQVPKEWVIPLPESLSLKQAMIYGTAGFTAGLCVWRMQQLDTTPRQGPILVTGASGGVGSIATSILAKLGYEVHACTGKKEWHQKLKVYGAAEIVSPETLNEKSRPLESALYAGAVDNLGGKALEHIIPRVHLWGNVACVGLAQSHELSTTVMPLILRGVSLLGISSANTPRELRLKIWQKLAEDWRPDHLEEMVTQEVSLDELINTASAMIDRKTSGRTLVDLAK